MKITLSRARHAFMPRCSGARLPKNQIGAEMVEFSLTVLYFLLLVFFIIEGTRFIFSYTVTSYHANDGLRYAVIRGSEADADDPDNLRADVPITADKIKSYIYGKRLLNFNMNNISATVSGTTPGSNITVTVSYPFYSGIPFLSMLNVTVGSTAKGVVIY